MDPKFFDRMNRGARAVIKQTQTIYKNISKNKIKIRILQENVNLFIVDIPYKSNDPKSKFLYPTGNFAGDKMTTSLQYFARSIGYCS